ncbi:MAG: ParB/RepB/Spo0J family partition protein [Ardenticatenaceae bacterium]|nr:ParB/RepB/Spo0J family partition protein [Anaerolineales bacterium]MCB8942064.1 ParB/RepB/Spo0J family partition protein [Ardenticatenaceae bacterium]MCB8973176.1 ParB/RepB/Spo0J family partition protein [Ardenticatenaceae bacterium]
MGRKKRGKINLSQPSKPHAGDLEKLFTTSEDVEQASGLVLLALRLDAIQPDPSQPRQTFPRESLEELSDSIRQDGVIQPIEVTEIAPNNYLIVHGERRWRAAQMAGLDTIPAVVQRRNYDNVTRFVRQLVENIQREDLNDVDRAAGLLRLRDLMQNELDTARDEGITSDEPWGNKISWAKVGKRLGYSRQRIHQLIKLLDLPDEIQEDIRGGVLSERDTRIYQGLKPSQQRALHKARLAGDLSPAEVKEVARYLKDNPDKTVYQTIRELQELAELAEEPLDPVFDLLDELPEEDLFAPANKTASALLHEADTLPDLAPGTMRVDNITRLGYIMQHLSRIKAQGLPPGEKAEVLRRLNIIQQHVNSLLVSLRED